MSQLFRNTLVDKLVFAPGQEGVDQRNDFILFLDGNYNTQTDLCQALDNLSNKWNPKGIYIGVTAVKTDHHDDSNLGLHCHFNGYCIDFWFLLSRTWGDWMDANDPRFAECCRDAAIDPFEYQEGLAGEALTHDAIVAAGKNFFRDDGGDHIHFGAK